MNRFFFLSILITFTIGINAQSTTEKICTEYRMADIVIIGYQTPVITKTRRQKRKADHYINSLRDLPPIDYSYRDSTEYNEIKNGIWIQEIDFPVDSTILEYQWRNYLSDRVKYPQEAIQREIEDTVIVEFDVLEHQVQNVILISENSPPVLVLDLFRTFIMIPFPELPNHESENFKCRISFVFTIRNKLLIE